MTIIGVASTSKETFFFSDRIRYYLTENTAEDVLNHRLEIDHNNLKEHIESYETDAPKIHRITRSTVLVCGGDGRFSDIIEGLNTQKDTVAQILERLKRKGNINAYWSCHIAQLGKLTSIIYKNGEIETKEQTTDTIWFDSFAPEIKEIFFKKYINFFYLATTQEKIKIINEFFKEVTLLFGGLAGGKAEIAILNEQGFQWIRSQNFTTYSMNWCPEKIDTEMATTVSWSSDLNWTDDSNDPLHLEVTCDSKMLLFINAYCRLSTWKEPSTSGKQIGSAFKLVIDTTDLPATEGHIANWADASSGYWVKGVYSCHTVAILEKGIHTIKLRVRMMGGTGVTAYFYDRRLSALKGFYQGGTL